MSVLPARRRLPVPSPFSVENLEKEIGDVVHTLDGAPEDYAPRTPLPAYVQHSPDVNETGRLTAEVVVQQYEETAKAIEAMSADMVEMQKRMEAEVQACHRVVEDLKALAQQARDEGKRAFQTIEQMAKLTEDVRTACGDMRLKLTPQ